MNLFLTDAELYEQTGYKRPSEQARWFRQQGYYVETNARGVPRITHMQINEKRRLNTSTETTPETKKSEPNILLFQAKLQNQSSRV